MTSKALNVLLLLLTVSMVRAFTQEELLARAQARYDDVMSTEAGKNDSTLKLIGTGSDLAGKASDLSEWVQNKTSVTTSYLSNTLKTLREAAMDKLSAVDQLLNRTSTAEKAVVEKGFAVVNKIIDEINEFTGWNITNEYEAADVSSYIQAKIEQANGLIGDIRTYIDKHVDSATEQLASVETYVNNTAGSIVTFADDSEVTLKNIASIMGDSKSINDDVARIATALGVELPAISGGSGVEFKMNYTQIMDAAKAVSNTVSQFNDIAASLPESKAKDKIQSILNKLNPENISNTVTQALDRVAQTVDTVEKTIGTITNTVERVKGTFDTTVNTGKNLANSISGLFNSFK